MWAGAYLQEGVGEELPGGAGPSFDWEERQAGRPAVSCGPPGPGTPDLGGGGEDEDGRGARAESVWEGQAACNFGPASECSFGKTCG